MSVCLIVVGALAPLCFLFSVFQNARPPATPRWLGPPLTQRSKNVGLDCVREIFMNQQEITTLTVIWARQLVSPQPKLGPVP